MKYELTFEFQSGYTPEYGIKGVEATNRDTERWVAAKQEEFGQYKDMVSKWGIDAGDESTWIGEVRPVTYFIFPTYQFTIEPLTISSASSARLSSENAQGLVLNICISDEGEGQTFGFALARGGKVLSSFQQHNGEVLDKKSPEKLLELLSISCDATRWKSIFDAKKSSMDAAILFSECTRLPVLIDTPIQESEFELRLQGSYYNVYFPADKTLVKYSYAFPGALEKPQELNRAVNPYAKELSVHLYKSDLPSGFLINLPEWCNQTNANYFILEEERYISIWNSAWKGEDIHTLAADLSQKFSCRVIGFQIHDDLFLSAVFVKQGIIVTDGIWGESRQLPKPALLAQNLDLDIDFKQNGFLSTIKDAANTFAEQLGLFITKPLINPQMNHVLSFEHGEIYSRLH